MKLTLRRELLGELGTDELRAVAGGTTTAVSGVADVTPTRYATCALEEKLTQMVTELIRYTQDTHQCTSYVQ